MNEKRKVVDELHKSARKNFERRHFEMRGIDDTFQADLVEFIPYSKQNKGFKYALVVIDVFSKYGWTMPLKSKTGKEVTSAMESVFEMNDRICKNLQTDSGKEFYNSFFSALMKKHSINHYSSYSKLKASICERFNKTLLNKLWKSFSLNGNYKWLSSLKQITGNYNNTKHRTIRMKPIDVNSSEVEQLLLNTVYRRNQTLVITSEKIQRFGVGDIVRISKHKTIFEKGYTINWTPELFKIIKVLPTQPVTYLLEDLKNQPIKGSFYELELQKTSLMDVYLVEKIIRRRGNKIFVKWLGFDEKNNSWISTTDLV